MDGPAHKATRLHDTSPEQALNARFRALCDAAGLAVTGQSPAKKQIAPGAGNRYNKVCEHQTEARGFGKGENMTRSGRVGMVVLTCLTGAFCPCSWAQYGGGSGTADDPFLIYTPEHFFAFASETEHRSMCFRLMEDIDLGAYAGDDYPFIGPSTANRFRGVFDGNGRTISNFTYVCPSAHHLHVGLFGTVDPEGRILNLGLIDPNVFAPECGLVGALAGFCQGTLINCYVENASVTGFHQVGGLVGDARAIYDCHASGSVTGHFVVGGLVGRAWQTAARSSATVDVVAGSATGGLAGLNEGVLMACFSDGSVSGEDRVGGLAGGSQYLVTDCYSACNVSGRDRVGGLLGMTSSNSVTARCFSTGRVTGTGTVGGLIGRSVGLETGNLGTVSACFWDTQTSGYATSAGGTGLTSVQMQTAAFFVNAGWDFVGETANGADNYWQLPKGRCYPRLFWQPSRQQIDPPWTDDFEDGAPQPLWQVHVSAGDRARVREVGGTLEVRTTAYDGTSRALCVSDGWMLDATEHFSLRVDFQFSRLAAGEGWVSLGLTPDANVPWAEYIEISAGCLEGTPAFAFRQATEAGWWVWWADRPSHSGRLYLSYDAAKDELYRSYTGYGPDHAWKVTRGLVGGEWGGKPLFITLGGGSSFGLALDRSEARLDNLVVDSGVATW